MHPFHPPSLSLKTQLTIIIYIIVSVPSICFTMFVLKEQNDAAWASLEATFEEKVEQQSLLINYTLQDLASMSNLYYLDEQLSTILKDYQDGASTLAQVQMNFRSIYTHYNAGSTCDFSAVVITEDWGVLNRSAFYDPDLTLDLSTFSWYPQLFASQVKTVWVQDSRLDELFSNNGHSNIYLIRKLHNRDDWSYLGTLIISISTLEIENLYGGYLTDEQSLFLLSQGGEIISSDDNLGVREAVEAALPQSMSFSGSFFLPDIEPKILTSYYTLSTSQWVVMLCYDSGNFIQSYSDTSALYITLMCLCLIVCFLLSHVVIRYYLAPLQTLQRSMSKVQHGQLNDVQLPVVHQDEIGQVTQEFNAMIRSLNDLLTKLVQESEAKRKAEIQALQYQISPHFIYNTLASVRFLIFSNEQKKADHIIRSLIQLLRSALSDSHQLITIDMELYLLESYIAIQQYTFSSPFQLVMDIDDSLRDCQTIKFLLQPLVENAIFHGLKPQHGGTLSISCQAQGDVIVFRIADDGVGFVVDDPAQTKGHPERDSIGLNNVDARIRLHFGQDFGLSVTSALQEGTCVVVRVPKIKQKEAYHTYEHPDCGR